MTHGIEPLEASLWFARIELIARGGLGSVENSLRHAAHLMQLAPASFRPAAQWAADERAFEALLDAEDFDSAARCLVDPEQLGLRAPNGRAAAARIACPLLDRVIDGVGGTIAAAVLDAWTKRLLALRDACGGGVDRANRVVEALAVEPSRRWN